MRHICDFASTRGGISHAPHFAPETSTGPGPAAPAPPGAASPAMPESVGAKGRRTLIKGGVVLSMDERVGNHAPGDALIEGSKILEVGASLNAPGAIVIDAAGYIVMPGFIDTHHHQFETALRSFLADGILFNDGRPESAHNYYEYILQKLSMGYRPQDVYINELFGVISQIDAGVTGVNGREPDPSFARTLRRRDRGFARRRASRRFRLFRGLGRKRNIPATPSASATNIFPRRISCSACSWVARSISRAMKRPGKSAAISTCRSPCMWSSLSACGRPSTRLRRKGSSVRIVCSSA